MSVDDRRQRLREELAALYSAYAAELPKKIAAIEAQWKQLKGRPSRERFKDLLRQVHGLAGSGATFGFATVSKIASRLELALAAYQEQVFSPAVSDTALDHLIDDLQKAAKEMPIIDLETPLPLDDRSPSVARSPVVFVLDQDRRAAEKLSSALVENGFRAETGSSQSDIDWGTAGERPVAIIQDISALGPDGRQVGGGDSPADSIPLFIISDRDDIHTRLTAVRSHARAFFQKPVDIKGLVEHLQALIANVPKPAYRILIVDDDSKVAYHTALILERAGMETRVVTDPMKIQEPLRELQPELILLDLYMPGCSGLELAAIIRQQYAYTGTAIVFFSVETDIDRHIDAMRTGGDEFLVKPIDPKRLVTVVEARARRTRTVRSLMMHDGLTGLLNRSIFENYLEREIARAARKKGMFAYGLIDVDNFKQVNDTFGHGAGDLVLKSLASTLSQRLRSIDIVCRYGGEEFAVILPDSDAKQGVEVLSETLHVFGQIKHGRRRKTFEVTFSAGVADYPRFTTVAGITEAADRALYEAKSSGRNRVVASRPRHD